MAEVMTDKQFKTMKLSDSEEKLSHGLPQFMPPSAGVLEGPRQTAQRENE